MGNSLNDKYEDAEISRNERQTDIYRNEFLAGSSVHSAWLPK
jgi:hypothetical protein